MKLLRFLRKCSIIKPYDTEGLTREGRTFSVPPEMVINKGNYSNPVRRSEAEANKTEGQSLSIDKLIADIQGYEHDMVNSILGSLTPRRYLSWQVIGRFPKSYWLHDLLFLLRIHKSHRSIPRAERKETRRQVVLLKSQNLL